MKENNVTKAEQSAGSISLFRFKVPGDLRAFTEWWRRERGSPSMETVHCGFSPPSLEESCVVGSIMSLEYTLWQENVSPKGTMLVWSRLTGRGPTAATEPLNKGVGPAGTSPRGLVGFWMQQGKPCTHPRVSCDRDVCVLLAVWDTAPRYLFLLVLSAWCMHSKARQRNRRVVSLPALGSLDSPLGFLCSVRAFVSLACFWCACLLTSGWQWQHLTVRGVNLLAALHLNIADAESLVCCDWERRRDVAY